MYFFSINGVYAVHWRFIPNGRCKKILPYIHKGIFFGLSPI